MTLKILESTCVFRTNIFDVESATFVPPGRDDVDAIKHFRIRTGDWVNVLPVTSTRHAVLIRQPRVGSESNVLETPGGGVEAGERDMTMAAARELEEETGLVSMRMLPLASLNPNPAIMTNRCHFFLAMDCQPAAKRKHFPDAQEFISLEVLPVHELDMAVRQGRVDHGISALCIMLAMRYLDQVSPK